MTEHPLEVIRVGDAVIVSHRGSPDSAVLVCSVEEWEEFLAGVRRGEFDLPEGSGE